MANLTLTIDGQTIEYTEGMSILEAADEAGIYIPRMCHHPDLPPADDLKWADEIHQVDEKITGENPGEKAGSDAHCNLCLVQVEDQPDPVNSCITPVVDGMKICTDSDNVIKQRRQALGKILSDHPHSCLTCAQKQGCSRSDCSSNVPVDERCCILLGRCELEKVSEFIGIPGDTPKYIPQKRPKTTDDPLYDRDFNLCIGCLRCVRVCQKVQDKEILGAVWKDNRAWVGTLTGAGLNDAQCRFCGACVEVCPTGALLDKENVPQVRHDSALPCVGNCPAGIDIPRYIQAIAVGQYREAYEIIRSRVPFPGILGYVCFHPCESNCRRGEIDEAVAICDLKRFVADELSDELYSATSDKPDSGKKVAIIGSGPAGLTAAYYLRTLGHQIDILDREDKPGGMLRYGIPAYRLPEEVLDRELKTLEVAGIQFHMKQGFDKQNGVNELKSKGYDAILMAAGTSESKPLPIEGSDLDGIHPGLEFLRTARISQEPKLVGQVVIIGGGNVAIDAAMTAVRLGGQEVHLFCLESRQEMPAHEWEIKQAEEEGVTIHPSWGPKRFISDNGRVSGIDFKRCVRVFDEQKRFDPKFDENETESIGADSVIVTIGQQVDAVLSDGIEDLSKGPGGTVNVDESLSVGIDGIFAAGDIVRGPSSVIDAITEGRQAADIIDKYLGGTGLPESIPGITKLESSGTQFSDAEFRQVRQMMETAAPEARKAGFGLIQETLSEEKAKYEARRCLRCHIRQNITSVTLPPEKWLPLNQESIETVPDSEGVFQLLDSDKKILRISGTADLRQDLSDCLENPGEAKWFIWEEDPMYTKRESELIQQYLQEHGEMPGGGGGDDDLDDLF
jgi:NADPH-dependent glutamate synthase beta subunit-like oxidoreductase/NAD-dependent dihydropyrimidine dehydrogenase PreA subunit